MLATTGLVGCAALAAPAALKPVAEVARAPISVDRDVGGRPADFVTALAADPHGNAPVRSHPVGRLLRATIPPEFVDRGNVPLLD